MALARCLDRGSTVIGALRRSESQLADRVAMKVRSSRRFGRIGQLEHRMLCWLRDRVLKLVPVGARLGQMEGIVGHEA